MYPCHLQITTVLFLPFQFRCPLFLLLVWLLWLGLPVLCWIREMKADIPLLREMLMLAVGFFVYGLYYVEVCSLYPTLLSFFLIRNRCWNISNAFSAFIDMIMWFLSFLLCDVLFIDLWILYHLCIPGMNVTRSWCMIFIMSCWMQLANVLMRILVSVFIRDIGM